MGSYCLVVTQVNHCIDEYAQWPITKATFFDLAVHPFRKPSSDNKWYSFQTPNWAELQIPKPRIPDSTGKNFPDSGIRHVWPDSPKIIAKVTKCTLIKMEEINIPVTTDVLLRACLRGGGGPQVGEVTRLGGVTRLSIQSLIFIWSRLHDWCCDPVHITSRI